MKKNLFLTLLFWSNIVLAQKGFISLPEGTERRFALVIGNKDYPAVGNLKNPTNDADDMSQALEKLGFEVIKITNVDYRGFMGAINRFKEKLTNSDVAFFYFSGHGASFGGKNYLLPTDTDTKCLEQIEEQGISLNRIIGEISAQKVRNSFVVLDACRNLPKLKVCDNTKKDLFINVGLVKPTNNPRGSLVVYATEEGSTADDNPTARNGLFTGALLKYLTIPNLTIKAILDKASLEVENKSGGAQSPGRYDKIFGDFYFIVSKETPAPNTPPTSKQPMNGEIKDLSYGPPMVFVKGGSFEMGSNQTDKDASEDEMINGKKHRVSVSDFWMAQTEVTVEQYLEFCDATKSHYPEWLENGSNYHIETGTDKLYAQKGYSREAKFLPITGISWHDADAYCEWLSKKTGLRYRLPTEAEWEFAARGGTESINMVYAGSNSANDVGWISSNSTGPHDVKQKRANELGIFDMTGNVWEWCQDWYRAYTAEAEQNPRGATMGSYRVLRGGSWYLTPRISRVAGRNGITPANRSNSIGFRVYMMSNKNKQLN